MAIEHLHKVARDLFVRSTGRSFSVLDPKLIEGLIETAKGRVAPSADFSVAFIKSEWNAIVDPWGIRSWPAYKGVSRAGRATPLGAKQRLSLWKIFEELQRILAERRLVTWTGLCYEAARSLEGARPYDHVIADECQDFGPAELTLLRALAAPGPDDLFLCSDAGQRIYRAAVAWSSTGIDVRGRSTRLSINYRTTEQIRRFADRILPEALDEGDGEKERRGTVSVLNGPHPEVHGFANVTKETEGVSGMLRDLLASGYKPQDIAIFARTEGVLRDRAEPALAKAGLAGHALSDEQPPSVTEVSVGTIYRAKGLEFKVVVVMGCDADAVPLAYLQKELVDEADRDAFLEQERHLLYVACTRARERLVITYSGTPSRWVRE